jgi:hypothetical protein
MEIRIAVFLFFFFFSTSVTPFFVIFPSPLSLSSLLFLLFPVGEELDMEFMPVRVSITDTVADLIKKNQIKPAKPTGGQVVRSMSEGHRRRLEGQARPFKEEKEESRESEQSSLPSSYGYYEY